MRVVMLLAFTICIVGCSHKSPRVDDAMIDGDWYCKNETTVFADGIAVNVDWSCRLSFDAVKNIFQADLEVLYKEPINMKVGDFSVSGDWSLKNDKLIINPDTSRIEFSLSDQFMDIIPSYELQNFRDECMLELAESDELTITKFSGDSFVADIEFENKTYSLKFVRN